MRQLPAQQVASADHAHRRAQPGSVDTGAIVDDAVTFAKVDESTFPATETAEVTTQQATKSTSYTDLATVGPAVTMTPPASGKVKVYLYAWILHDDPPFVGHMGVVLSGGNTLAVSDSRAISGEGVRLGATFLLSGLAAVSTTFTTKYKSTTPTFDARFGNRKIIVEPVLA